MHLKLITLCLILTISLTSVKCFSIFGTYPASLQRWCAQKDFMISTRKSTVLKMGGVGGWDFDDYDPSAAYEAYSMEDDMVTIGEKKSGDTRSDEELLEEMRETQRLKNDLWQFGTFDQLCGGEWQGYWTEYTAENKGDDTKLVPKEPIKVKTTCSRLDDHGNDLKEDSKLEIIYSGVDGEIETLSKKLQATFIPMDFRGVNGNLVNKNTFSLGRRQGDSIIIENAVSEEGMRVKSILEYKLVGKEGGDYALAAVYVCREAKESLPKLGEGPLYGEGGSGIYDIPRSYNPEDYLTVYEEGLLTLRFPTKIQKEAYGAITTDWTPSAMRYQADRVFKRFDASLYGLEVIEISAEYSKQYAPEFPK